MSDIKCKCANCDWSGAQSETETIRDFWSRVEPGEIIPHGDCPKCGAFCYPAKTKAMAAPVAAMEG